MKPSYFIVSFCIVLLLVMLWITIINQGSASLTSSLLKSLLGPVILSAFLFMSELTAPIEPIKEEIYAFAPRQAASEFWSSLTVVGSNHAHGLFLIRNLNWNSQQLPKINQFPNSIEYDEKIRKLYFDKFEILFWNWIWETYGGHWQRRFTNNIGISSASGGGIEVVDAESNPQKFTKADIQEFLDDNQALKTFPDLLNLTWLGFPVGTKISVTNNYPLKSIVFLTDNIQFKIELNSGGYERMGGGPLAAKIRAKILVDPIEIDFFRISFEVKTSKVRRWSPYTEKQINWAKQFIEKFKDDFSWELIKNDLEKL